MSAEEVLHWLTRQNRTQDLRVGRHQWPRRVLQGLVRAEAIRHLAGLAGEPPAGRELEEGPLAH